jgi:hypothetical protein
MFLNNNSESEVHPANWHCVRCGEIIPLYHQRNFYGNFACHCGETELQLIIHTIKLSQLTHSIREALENS